MHVVSRPVGPASRLSAIVLASLFVGTAFVGLIVASAEVPTAVASPVPGPTPVAFAASPRVDTVNSGEAEPSIKIDRANDLIYLTWPQGFCRQGPYAPDAPATPENPNGGLAPRARAQCPATVLRNGIGGTGHDLRSSDIAVTNNVPVTAAATPPGWQIVTPPFSATPSQFDADIAVDGAGTLYAETLGPLINSEVWASADHGASWLRYDPASSRSALDDRAWLVAGPAANIAYESVHTGALVVCGSVGVSWTDVIHTTDGGQTWSAPTLVDPPGSATPGDCKAGAPAVDPRPALGSSRVIIPLATGISGNQIQVFESTDTGATFHTLGSVLTAQATAVAAPPPGCSGGSSNNVEYIFPGIAAIDGAGTAYVTWSQLSSWSGPGDCGASHIDQFYVYKSTTAADWSTPIRLSDYMPAGMTDGMNVMGWITGGDAGRLGVAFYHSNEYGDTGTANGAGSKWYAVGGTITGADTATPSVQLANLGITTQNPTGVVRNGPVCTIGTGCSTGRDLLDFLMSDYDSQGALVVTYSEDAGNAGTIVSTATGDEYVRIAKETRGPGLLAAGDVRYLAGFSLASSDFVVGTTNAVVAQELDQFGQVLPRAAQVPYNLTASSDAGTLSNGVLSTAHTAGTFAGGITATALGYFEAAPLTQPLTIHLLPGPVDHVGLTPPSANLITGATQTFAAKAYDQYGNAVTTQPPFTYAVTGTVGSVGPATGVFSAITNLGGAASRSGTVTATGAGLTGSASVTVAPGPLDHIVVSPDGASVVVGQTKQFTAKGYDQYDNVRNMAPPAWSLSGGAGSINGVGLLTAGTRPDLLTITATSGGMSGSASLTVVHGAGASLVVDPASATVTVGASQSFNAVEQDAYGNPFAPGGPIAWSAVSGSVSSAGLYTAPTVVGSDQVKAVADGLTGTASISVVHGATNVVVVSPDPASVAAGATQQFTAVANDQYGNLVDDKQADFTWSSDIGSIDQTGVLTAPTGVVSGTVSASLDGVPGSAPVNVVAGPLAAIHVSPSSAIVPVHSTQAFTATGADQYGNPVPVSPTWTTSAGSIDASGLLTAPTNSGALTVMAAQGAINDTASVIVVAGPLDHLIVSPANPNVVAGKTQQFFAEGFDQYGNPVDITPTWSASIGVIDGSGVFTAPTLVQSGTITATSGSASDQTTVTIVPDAPVSIVVSPATATVAAGDAQAFSAAMVDQYGNAISSVQPVWSATAGSIDAFGNFRAPGSVGAVTITATSGTAPPGTASVTVVAGPLHDLKVTPENARVAANSTLQFSASGEDMFGNAVPLTSAISWSTTDGSIDANGLLTAPTTAPIGFSTVTASADGAFGSTLFQTVAAGIVSVAVTPDSPTLTVGTSQAFTAIGTDVYGNRAAITNASWAASDGTVDASGNFKAPTVPETVTLEATDPVSNVSGTTTISVVVGPIATVTVTPASARVAVTESTPFTAAAVDAYGNPVATTFSWGRTGAPATIDGSGLLTAGTLAGTGTVTATAGGITGTASLTIGPGPVASVTISPTSPSIPAGAVRLFTATAFDAYANKITSDPSAFTFAASRGTVDATGLYAAPTTTGADSVTASVAGFSATASVTVVPGPLVTIAVTPGSTLLNLKETQTFTASGADAYGNLITIAPASLTWSADAAAGSIVKNGDGTATFTATDVGDFAHGVSAKAFGVTGYAHVEITDVYGVSVVMSDYEYRVSQLVGPHGVVVVLDHAGVPMANANAHIEISSAQYPITFFYENGPTDANGVYGFSMMPANLAAPPGGYLVVAYGAKDGNTGQDVTRFAVSLNRNIV